MAGLPGSTVGGICIFAARTAVNVKPASLIVKQRGRHGLSFLSRRWRWRGQGVAKTSVEHGSHARHPDGVVLNPDDFAEPDAGDFCDTLRRLLRTELLRGQCSVEEVAGLCRVHRRTLSRRLKAEGTAFRQIANEVQFEIASRLLSNRRITFGQIATTLGYSEASAFTRAFRRWSGQTPTAWRAAQLRARRAVRG
jgi:AraC-like DNA-binding protein